MDKIKLLPLIGIPYQNLGSDLNGCDCWGAIQLYFRTMRNVELPTYSKIVNPYAYIQNHNREASLFVDQQWSSRDKRCYLPLGQGYLGYTERAKESIGTAKA